MTVKIYNFSAHSVTDQPQYVTMRGTLADTEEMLCDADFSTLEGDKVCTLTSDVNIGDFRCVRWRLGGADGWNMGEVGRGNILTVAPPQSTSIKVHPSARFLFGTMPISFA